MVDDAGKRIDEAMLEIRAALSLQGQWQYSGSLVEDIQRQLCDRASSSFRILSEGVYRTIVLDATWGVGESGDFDFELFLRQVHASLSQSFDVLATSEGFHPEVITQMLKDEAMSLLCVLNVQYIEKAGLERLRGLGCGQGHHRILYCGNNEVLTSKTVALGYSMPTSVLLDDDGLSSCIGDSGILFENAIGTQNLRVQQSGETTRIVFGDRGMSDVACIHTFYDQIRELIEQNACRILILDMRGVWFLPSRTLEALLSLRKCVDRVELHNVSEELREGLRVSQLDKVFHVAGVSPVAPEL